MKGPEWNLRLPSLMTKPTLALYTIPASAKSTFSPVYKKVLLGLKNVREVLSSTVLMSHTNEQCSWAEQLSNAFKQCD